MRRNSWSVTILSLVMVIAVLLVGCTAATPTPTSAPKPATTATTAPAVTTISSPVPTVKPTPTPPPTTTAKPSTPTPTVTVKPSPTAAPKPQLPSEMMWTSLQVGSGGYQAAVALGFALRQYANMMVRVLPSASGVSRIMAIQSGAADIAFLGFEAECAIRALEEFTVMEWGPQKLVSLLTVLNALGVVTAGDSGIKTMADIKGSRVAWVPGHPSGNLQRLAVLAFAGLTRDDVKWVEFSSNDVAGDGLLAGKIDWHSATTAQPKMFQLEAARGIRWIPLPAANKEGWKRFQQFYAGQPGLLNPGAGVKEGDVKEGILYNYPMLVTYQGRLSDDVAYALVKALDEAYEKYIKDTFPSTHIYKFENASKVPTGVPYHPGAIRYAKEKGLWTAEHEAANNALLDEMTKTQKAWAIVLDEALTKKMKETEYPAYWLKRKAELVK